MDTEETKVEGVEEVVETPATDTTDMPAEENTEADESTVTDEVTA